MGPAYEVRTFDRLTLFGRRWFFTIYDTGNWERISQSEGYNTKRSRDATANKLAAALGVVPIPERKKP